MKCDLCGRNFAIDGQIDGYLQLTGQTVGIIDRSIGNLCRECGEDTQLLPHRDSGDCMKDGSAKERWGS